MTICTHLCRGNFRSGWMAEGSYEHVAEALFNELDVDGFFLEYDDERSGGFEPLRFVPKGKMVVLGLVTTKSPALESKDELKRRIDEAAKYVPLEQLCLSPQCGFASTAEGNLLTHRRSDRQAPAGGRDRARGVGLDCDARGVGKGAHAVDVRRSPNLVGAVPTNSGATYREADGGHAA